MAAVSANTPYLFLVSWFSGLVDLRFKVGLRLDSFVISLAWALTGPTHSRGLRMSGVQVRSGNLQIGAWVPIPHTSPQNADVCLTR